jgi:hypothetical protein
MMNDLNKPNRRETTYRPDVPFVTAEMSALMSPSDFTEW